MSEVQLPTTQAVRRGLQGSYLLFLGKGYQSISLSLVLARVGDLRYICKAFVQLERLGVD